MTKNKKIIIIGGVFLIIVWATMQSQAANTTDNGLDDGEPGDDEMKTKEFLKYVEKTIFFEGGATIDRDPDDAGGTTKYGIDQLNHPDVDIENLTKQQAIDIYYKEYWMRYRIFNVPKHLRFVLFDSCVTPGPGFAIKALQRLAHVYQDGIIGPVTAQAALSVTADQFSAARWDYYLYKIANRPRNIKFKDGWRNRTDDALAYQKSLY